MGIYVYKYRAQYSQLTTSTGPARFARFLYTGKLGWHDLDPQSPESWHRRPERLPLVCLGPAEDGAEVFQAKSGVYCDGGPFPGRPVGFLMNRGTAKRPRWFLVDRAPWRRRMTPNGVRWYRHELVDGQRCLSERAQDFCSANDREWYMHGEQPPQITSPATETVDRPVYSG